MPPQGCGVGGSGKLTPRAREAGAGRREGREAELLVGEAEREPEQVAVERERAREVAHVDRRVPETHRPAQRGPISIGRVVGLRNRPLFW